jgi:hypothetical protein
LLIGQTIAPTMVGGIRLNLAGTQLPTGLFRNGESTDA